MAQPSTVTNGRVLFNKVPSDYPIPGETTVYEEQDFDLNVALNGGVLVKLLAISIDPYLRGRMRIPEKKSYNQPFEIGKPLVNYAIGLVLRSENPKVQANEHVYGIFEWQNYVVLGPNTPFRVVKNTEKLPWSVYVGAAGMPGHTAFVAWKLFSKAKKGETVYISTAAGPVGSIVAQIAQTQGLKVIGSTGSDAKVAFLRDDLKIDVAFNYKTTNTLKILEDNGGIDIYWDNVGGTQLEAAITAGHNFLRIINCGSISGYNGTPLPISNINEVVSKRISMNGFIVNDHPEVVDEANEWLPGAIARGEIKYREHTYTLKEAGQGILDVQKGDNTAKAVIVL